MIMAIQLHCYARTSYLKVKWSMIATNELFWNLYRINSGLKIYYHDVNSQYVEEFSRVIRNFFISQVTILNDK